MDNKVTEVLEIQGDHKGAVSSLKTIRGEMQATERTASSFGERVANTGSGVIGWLGKMSAGVGKMAGIFTGGFALGARGMLGLGAASGIATGKLLGVNAVLAVGIATLGAFVGHAARIAGMSDQADRLGKTWQRTLNQMSAPLVNTFAQALDIVNQTLQNPAVQHFLGWITGLAQAILSALIPALRGAAAAVVAFLTAIQGGDFLGAFGKAWDAFTAEINKKSKDAGAAAGATFSEGWNEGLKRNPPEPPKLQEVPGGFLKDIGDLGTRALNAFLAGFRKPDLDALNATGDAIRTRLETLFKNSKLPALRIAPQLVIDQTAVARALSDAAKPGADLEGIIGRVRGELSHLGPDVQEFVEAQLRAVSATRDLEKAQNAVTTATENLTKAAGDLLDKENELKGIQNELTEARRRQAEEAAKLLPLSDKIRDTEQEIQRIIIAQTEDRKRLVDMAEEQEDVAREIARLEAEQAQKLAELAPLRQAVADATEAHRQAELAVRDAQDALIPLQERLLSLQKELTAASLATRDAQDALVPLQEKLTAEREALANFSKQAAAEEKGYEKTLRDEEKAFAAMREEVAERQRLTKEGIEDEQNALEDRIAEQERLLDAVDATHKADLDGYKATLAAVDARYKDELDAQNKLLANANKLLASEESRNRVALLRFARQRQEAQGITDVNKRVQALAKINREEEIYNASVADRLDATRLEAQLQQDSLQIIEDKVAAEKGDVPERLKALEELIKKEKEPIEERLKAIEEEGKTRIENLRREAEEQQRMDEATIRAAEARVQGARDALERVREANELERATFEARVEAAQQDVAAQQQVIAGLEKQEEAARRRVEAAQADINAQQQIVAGVQRQEELASRRVETADHELTQAEKRVTDEYAGTLATLRERERVLGVEREALDDRLGDERRGAELRLEDAQNEYNLRKSEQEELADLENRPIQARLNAAQLEVDKAQELVSQRQAELTTAEGLVTAAQKVVDGYTKTAELAKARLDFEGQTASTLDSQRQLLDQIAQAQAANAEALANYQKQLADFNAGGGATKGTLPEGIGAGGIGIGMSEEFQEGMKAGEEFFGKIGSWIQATIGLFGSLRSAWDVIWLHITSGRWDLVWDDMVKLFGPAAEQLGLEMDRYFPGFKAKWDDIWDPNRPDSGPVKFGRWLDSIAERDANGDIKNGFSGFEEFFQDIEDFLNDPGAKFVDWMNDWSASDTPFSNFLMALGDPIADFISNLTKLPKIAELELANLLLVLIDKLEEIYKALPEPLRNVLPVNQQLWDELKKDATDRVQELKEQIEGKSDSMATNVTKSNDKLVKDGVRLFNELKDKAAPHVEALKKEAERTVSDMWNNITSRFDRGKSDNVSKAEDLKRDTSTQMDQLRTSIVGSNGTWTLFNEDLSKKFDDTRKGLTDPTGQVSSLASQLNTGFTQIKDTELGASGPWVLLTAGITQKFDDTKKAIIAEGGQLSQLGTGLDAGLGTINTQTRRTDGPLTKVGEFISSVFGTAKNKVVGEGGELPQLASQVDTGLGSINTQARREDGPLARIGQIIVGTFSGAKDTVVGEKGTLETLNTDSDAVLSRWPAAVTLGLRAIVTAWEGVFGSGKNGTTQGAIAKILMAGDRPGGNEETGGLLPWMEAVIRRVLDYQKEEVWLSGFNAIKDGVKTFVDEKMKGEWVTKFETLGAAVAGGIAKGIADNTHLVTAAATKAVTDALAAANHAAGDPHSPAPAFVPLGYNIGWGIAFGLSRASDLVSQAAAGLVDLAARAGGTPTFGAISLPTISPGTDYAQLLPGTAGNDPTIDRGTTHWHASVVQFNEYNAQYDPFVEELRGMLSR